MPKIVTRRSARLLKQSGAPYNVGNISEEGKAIEKPIDHLVTDSIKSTCTTTDTSNSTGSTSHSLAVVMIDDLRNLIQIKIAQNKLQSAKYAKQMEKYMRQHFTFYGLKAPELRAVTAEWMDKYQIKEKMDRKTLMELLKGLWEEDNREMQTCGCDLAKIFNWLLEGANTEEYIEGMSCIEHLLTTKSWWDTVDPLSYQVAGHMIKSKPEIGVSIVDGWISHENMWLRRAAILHQLLYKEDTDKTRLFRYCLDRGHEKEFFIRKSIGWALRQYGRTDPESVKAFVQGNKDKLSTLSIKEAMKHLL